MARWYAKFDAGSVSALDSLSGVEGYFEKLRVGGGSASAALLRDGLIASRSAVSNDVYDDLDAANKDGSKGTYFPPDIRTLPTSTLISWSTAYTSSVNGIKTPTSNTYGVSDSINYSLRPTSSVTSSQTTLVGPTNPLDPVQLNYNVYLSASAAVRVVIDAFQTASTSTSATPYTRPGQNVARTLHSIWHNPTLDYFAWDDFSPGQLQDSNLSWDGTTNPATASITTGFTSDDLQYKNDGNPNGKVGIWIQVSSGSYAVTLNLREGGTHGGALPLNSNASGTGPANIPSGAGNSTWTWDYATRELDWDVILTCTGGWSVNSIIRFYDAIIPTHEGSDFTKTLTNQNMGNTGACTCPTSGLPCTVNADCGAGCACIANTCAPSGS